MSFILVDNVFDGVNGILPGQKLVLLALAKFADSNGKSWPSVQTIASMVGMGVRTVARHIASLIKLGYLERIYRAGRSSITRITARVLNMLSIGQTTAKLAPIPRPNWQTEPVTESINQKTAQSQIDSIAAAAVIVAFEIPAIPDIQQPTDAVPPIASEKPLPAPATTANPFDNVPVQLIEDFGIVRKNKKKPAKITSTEAVIFAAEAAKSGLTIAEAVTTCITRGWSRFNASWLPAKPVEARTAAYVPEVAQPVTQEIKSAGLAALTALRAKGAGATDPLKWARDAVDRDAAGERVGCALLRNAKMALRI